MSCMTSDEIRKGMLQGVPVFDEKLNNIYIKPLITPYHDDRLSFIEGAAYDLTLDKIYISSGQTAILKQNSRQLPIPNELCKCGQLYLLREGMYVFQTAEEINVPMEYFADLRPKSTFMRAFANVTVGTAHPNYQGRITFSVQVTQPMQIEQGVRILYVRFIHIGKSSEIDGYKGIWNGDKLVTEGKERAF